MIPALPPDKVSRNRATPDKCKPVMMAIVRTEGVVISSSCGWSKVHHRNRVRENAAQRHLDKHHGGQGLWL